MPRPWDGHLGQLERHISGVPDHLGADLDQLAPQRRQCPSLHAGGQRQPTQEVVQVVCQQVQLPSHLIRGEVRARQVRSAHGVLAFPDPLHG